VVVGAEVNYDRAGEGATRFAGIVRDVSGQELRLAIKHHVRGRRRNVTEWVVKNYTALGPLSATTSASILQPSADD
jgi:hypothetical protein